MTEPASRAIVRALAPELPEGDVENFLFDIAPEDMAHGLVMFAEDTSVDTDNRMFVYAPYPEAQHVTGDDEWGARS